MVASYLDLPKAVDGLSLGECSGLGKEILGITLFILMKKNYFGFDELVRFCVLCDVMLFYCVIFLSMQCRLFMQISKIYINNKCRPIIVQK